MKRLLSILFASAAIGLIVTSAHATLIDRGGGLIYDDDLNITWLQDANYAMTSGYDADGAMNYAVAINWVQNLVYGGFDDWRLPYTPQPDPNCDGHAYNCSGGEMGHLFYIEGVTFVSPSPFFNLSSDHYWYSPGQAANTAITFQFNGGRRGSYTQNDSFFVMAVRDGDIAAASVPEPGTMMLVGSGLVGLAAFRRRFSRRHG